MPVPGPVKPRAHRSRREGLAPCGERPTPHPALSLQERVLPRGSGAGRRGARPPFSPCGRREERVVVPVNLIPAPPTHPYPALAPPDQGGCREASCGRAECGVHGRELSRAFDHGGAVDRQGRNWAGPSPCRDVGATRDPQTTARGTGWRLLALLRHFDSTSTSARSRRLRRHLVPRIPLDTLMQTRKPRGTGRSGLSVRRDANHPLRRHSGRAQRRPGIHRRANPGIDQAP